MQLLRSKLIELEERKRAEELAKERGEVKDVAWGSQIRSYVLHPYTMVKDHRTEHEAGDAQRVLDGDLDELRPRLPEQDRGRLGELGRRPMAALPPRTRPPPATRRGCSSSTTDAAPTSATCWAWPTRLDPERRLRVVTPRAPLQLPGSPGYHWYLVPRVGYPDRETFEAARAALA